MPTRGEVVYGRRHAGRTPHPHDPRRRDRLRHLASARGANFSNAIMIGADLTQADFTGARLYQAIGTELKAQQARLVNCDLTYADLSHAVLDRADLSGATLFRTNFHKVAEEGAQIPSRRAALRPDADRATAEDWHARWPAQPVAPR